MFEVAERPAVGAMKRRSIGPGRSSDCKMAALSFKTCALESPADRLAIPGCSYANPVYTIDVLERYAKG